MKNYKKYSQLLVHSITIYLLDSVVKLFVMLQHFRLVNKILREGRMKCINSFCLVIIPANTLY
jgi:hypothetical protein